MVTKPFEGTYILLDVSVVGKMEFMLPAKEQRKRVLKVSLRVLGKESSVLLLGLLVVYLSWQAVHFKESASKI